MIDIYGKGRYLQECGATLLHQDEFGKLWRSDQDDDEPLVMVQVVNSSPELDGSHREYFLRVPPNMQRARQAVAWTFDVEEKEYQPILES